MHTLRSTAERAKQASFLLAALDGAAKNRALACIERDLSQAASEIAAANARDLEEADRLSLVAPLRKRLRFDAAKIEEACAGLRSLIALPDPVGRRLCSRELDEGLVLHQVTCPIGLIGVVFESRPDALIQISALCLKSGNAVLLKGGSEARATNRVLAAVVTEAGRRAGLPEGWLGLLETRDEVADMLALSGIVDLIIPRGSNEFVRRVMDSTSIPVLGHADGVCHQYVHADADLDMAVRLAIDSKTQYVAVCNAMETLLVHAAIAPAFLPAAAAALHAVGVRLRGCSATRAIIECEPAGEEDWGREYLDYVLSVRIVATLEEAVAHINGYGSHHTDGIVTSDPAAAAVFMERVDSASVFHNASTRFADGYRYGLGAEVGISTSKIHARGPVGLEGLLIYKWRLHGQGQIVADYAEGRRSFTHRTLEGARGA